MPPPAPSGAAFLIINQMLPRVKINYLNGLLGAAPDNQDGLLGLVVLGATAVSTTFALGTPYRLVRPDDLAALGISAKLTGVANLRYKESNRLESIAEGLKKLGREVTVEDDVMLIPAGEPFTKESLAKADEIDSFDDHRIAMAFGVLRVINPDLKIKNPDVVSKSFPDFWKMLDRLIF